jgi:HAD superfamily hydrolase (TIGR01509 family)
MIRALIFDFDGTIIDSETPVFEGWKQTYAEHGHELPLERYVEIIGTAAHTFDPHAHLEGLIGRTLDREQLTAERQLKHRAVIYSNDTLPGVRAWIEEATVLQMPLAIASSSQAWWVDSNLTRLQLREKFKVLRTREMVASAKPAPDLFLAALDGLGLKPHEAVVIEDSAHGVAAAKAAGLFTIAVPNPVTVGLDFSGADMVVSSLAELPMAAALAAATGSVRR